MMSCGGNALLPPTHAETHWLLTYALTRGALTNRRATTITSVCWGATGAYQLFTPFFRSDTATTTEFSVLRFYYGWQKMRTARATVPAAADSKANGKILHTQSLSSPLPAAAAAGHRFALQKTLFFYSSPSR